MNPLIKIFILGTIGGNGLTIHPQKIQYILKVEKAKYNKNWTQIFKIQNFSLMFISFEICIQLLKY